MNDVQPQQRLTREEIRDTFQANRGAAARLAEELGISATVMSHVLAGKMTSRRVFEAARARALELRNNAEAA